MIVNKIPITLNIMILNEMEGLQVLYIQDWF